MSSNILQQIQTYRQSVESMQEDEAKKQTEAAQTLGAAVDEVNEHGVITPSGHIELHPETDDPQLQQALRAVIAGNPAPRISLPPDTPSVQADAARQYYRAVGLDVQ